MTIIDCREAKSPLSQTKSMSQNNDCMEKKHDSSTIDWSKVIKGEKIGSGGFSDVYKAKYRHKEIAIKFILKKNRSRTKVIQDLTREATVLAVLTKEQHIIRFLGVSFIEPFCMAIELCRGGSLQKLIKKFVHVPLKTIISWSLQVAKGISVMHNKKPCILHRDIKTDNVLVKQLPCECISSKRIKNSNGEMICEQCGYTPLENLLLKISDFGLAGVKNEIGQNMEGSLPWMAPEYIRELVATTQTDIWSYGVLLWEILTKEVPYIGQDEQTLLFACNLGIRPPKKQFTLHWIIKNFYIAQGWVHLTIPDDCPENLKETLESIWNEDREKRPSIDEIIDLLRCGSGNIAGDYIYICNTENLIKKTNEELQYVKEYVNVNQIDIEETIKTGKECYISLAGRANDQSVRNFEPTIPSSPQKSTPKSPTFFKRLEKWFTKLPKTTKNEEASNFLTIPSSMSPCKSENDIHHLIPPKADQQKAYSTEEIRVENFSRPICIENRAYISMENQQKSEVSKSTSNFDHNFSNFLIADPQNALCIQNLSYIRAENQTYAQLKVGKSSSHSCSNLNEDQPNSYETPCMVVTISNGSYLSIGNKVTEKEKKSFQEMRPRAHSNIEIIEKNENESTQSYEKTNINFQNSLTQNIEEPRVKMRMRATTGITTRAPTTAEADKNFVFTQSMPIPKNPPPLPARSPKLEACLLGYIYK